jgi:hypothetical protein
MAQFPRGISPELLVSQVRNTMPYLFEGLAQDSALGRLPPTRWVLDYAATIHGEPPNEAGASLSHFEYFRLCVSAHYLTCATPVPTDVDNQIRKKLWPENLPLEVALQMAELVLEVRHWNFEAVSARFAFGARGTELENQAVDGHLGEWFTLASAAYCALGQYRTASGLEPEALGQRQALLAEIRAEVNRHSEIFASLWRAQDGLGCLKASASLAHNLGDLDRVVDMWEVPVTDPLRLEFYKLGVTPYDSERKLRHLGRLWVAGELYKSLIGASSMAFENHRHFALRKPRCLRGRPEFLVPIGPFLDDWGMRVARALALPGGEPSEATREVIEALAQGWERLPKTLGYGRALRGILQVHPGIQLQDLGLGDLKRNHPFRVALETPQDRFEKTWATEALVLLDDIPSRA